MAFCRDIYQTDGVSVFNRDQPSSDMCEYYYKNSIYTKQSICSKPVPHAKSEDEKIINKNFFFYDNLKWNPVFSYKNNTGGQVLEANPWIDCYLTTLETSPFND